MRRSEPRSKHTCGGEPLARRGDYFEGHTWCPCARQMRFNSHIGFVCFISLWPLSIVSQPTQIN